MTHFRMPAEWEPQSAVWASWPHNAETWPLDILPAAQSEWSAMVRAIVSSGQTVFVMVPKQQMEDASLGFGDDANVRLVPIETDDAWARDYAPTFVEDKRSGELVAIDWHYNGWGEKYPPFDSDQQVAKKVADFLQTRHLAGGLCGEGGAIEISQSGVLLTTESCFPNPNRNPGLVQSEVERLLKDRLGCHRVVWLPGDPPGSQTLYGDDTDGHIDQLARFVDNDTIVHAWVESADPRRDAIAANVDALARQLPEANLVPLMLPQPFELFGRAIPASYCNFLVTNDLVIVPQFDVPEDEAALKTLAGLFGDRVIEPLGSRILSFGLGSFHCLTQQQPSFE